VSNPTLRISRYTHRIDLPHGSALAIHAVSQTRLKLASEVADLLRFFEEPSPLKTAVAQMAAILGAEDEAVRDCITGLTERGLLTIQDPEAEAAATAHALADSLGRDPADILDQFRRTRMEGAHPYWSVEAPRALADARTVRHRTDILLLGDCDLQMEADFLRREGERRGIGLRVAASFPADTALAGERPHDAIVIGALQARHAIVAGDPEHHGGDPARVYVTDVETMLLRLRALSAAPILIDGLPEPTVQPLGFADRGPHSHRNRIRRTNLALADLAERHTDVFLVDTAAELGQAGSQTLLDDGLVSFTHFGSPGWMLQRPSSERAAVHDQFPDLQPLADRVGGDPYRRETTMARAHMDALVTVLGIGRKKCVIVDLDGVLWPGVLAETGAPFAWTPEISSANSFVGLYFGIHEALLMLRRRGILLACVSKNDQETVRRLWQYGPHYPLHRLLTPDHFVCSRINWDDKAANIQSIADELGFPLDAFLFVDDSERERQRVQQALPDVDVLGEDLFALRRALLTDPRLQQVRLTRESGDRSALVKAQLERGKLREAVADEASFLASLCVEATAERLTQDHEAELGRVAELIARTTQFNATGRTFSLDELRRIAAAPDGRVIVLRMRDRLANHGLVGAAVVLAGDILNVVQSCRVIGLGGERTLLDAVLAAPGSDRQALTGRIVPTDRNTPVRNLYAAHGFHPTGDGCWRNDAPLHRLQEQTAHAG
jgi:FkbH-like protein